ncbi:hypothetical protein [uncultured Oscillibacter sp.]|uniref:hypothetical protein n=1 Tax=uncultured Oscillibacter sp. TaxID=876091 RepID=UPI00262053FA|nr:hypothetical protein [uncultured Oscillibacter sp.]
MTYRELYFHLFGVIEDAVDAFEAGQGIRGMQVLLEALRDGEEAHMNQDILPDGPVPET